MVDCKEQESEMLSLLKSLKLKNLPQLDYNSKRDPIGFTYISQLSILHVHDCDNLRYLFPHSMKCMLQLKELDIRRCKMVSRIVADKKGQGKSWVDKIGFAQLKILRLYDLPNLVSFFPKVIVTSATSTERHQNVMQTIFNEKVVFPTLEVLELENLYNLEGLGHIPISVDSFSKLRKLHVKHCGKWLCVFPSQFHTRLRNLEDLTVENCCLLEKVFELEMYCEEQESEKLSLLKSLKLKHLPQLDYVSKRDPIGFMYISQLSILHVHDCHNLRYLFPHSMKCMLQLQELDIRRCKMMSRIVADEKGQGKSWVDKIGFAQLKILRLYDLPNLVSFFPKVIVTSATSTERHQNVMQTIFNEKVVFPTLEVLELERLDNLEGLGHIPISVDSFSKLRKLHVKHCGKWLCVFPSQFLTRLRNLEDLTVENCSLLEKVFELEMVDSKEQESKKLSLLKSLKLKHLPQLDYISKRDPIGYTYISQLSVLHVHDCDNLRYLFSHSMMKCMLQLQELDIRRCKMISRVVVDEKGQGKSSVDKIEFTQLKILRLYDLPNLVSFFSKVIATSTTSTECRQNVMQTLFNEKVAFPSLEELELQGFQNMNEKWCNQLQTGSFSKLIKLYIFDCGSLRNLFSLFVARYLVHLKRLVIKNCSMMEEVVAKEEDEEEEDEEGRITPLPKLECLDVTHNWELPLVDVTVLDCPKMKTFSPGVVCTPKLQCVFVKERKSKWSLGIEGEDWIWISDLNQTIQLIEKILMIEDELNLSFLDCGELLSLSPNDVGANQTSEHGLLSELNVDGFGNLLPSFSSIVDEVFELERGSSALSFSS